MVGIEYQIIAKNYDLAGRFSSDLKKMLKQNQTDRSLMKRICSASYEAEINVVIHSFGGYAICTTNDKELILDFHDDGPGIIDIELAMQEGYSTATDIDHINGFGAGMGLSNIKKCSDIMEINSTPDGTHLHLVFYLEGDLNHDF